MISRATRDPTGRSSILRRLLLYMVDHCDGRRPFKLLAAGAWRSWLETQITRSPRFENPINDARDVAAALQRREFHVTTRYNASKRQRDEASDQFAKSLRPGDLALFYYSGHGAQVNQENYLIPVDFQGASAVDIRYNGLPVSMIRERLEQSGARLPSFDPMRPLPKPSSISIRRTTARPSHCSGRRPTPATPSRCKIWDGFTRTASASLRMFHSAADWYHKASASGNLMAMNQLGNFYQSGRGVAVDYVTAMQWYRRAAEGGVGYAMLSLDGLYENGHGVAADRNQALAWYRKADSACLAEAKAAIARPFDMCECPGACQNQLADFAVN